MDFSESFGLGTNTFMDLESEVKKALLMSDRKPGSSTIAQKSNTNAFDIIDESPTNSINKQNKSRSRNHAGQFGVRRKKKFQKSKSDSTLEEKPAKFDNVRVSQKYISTEDENYSQFFKSEFSIEVDQITKNKPMSFVNTSEIESAMKFITDQDHKNGVHSTHFGFEDSKMFSQMIGSIKSQYDFSPQKEKSSDALEAPVFSEDLRELLNDSYLCNDAKGPELVEIDQKESLKLSQSQGNSFSDIGQLNVNANGGIMCTEEIINIDNATFICPDEDGRSHVEKIIKDAKIEMQSALSEEVEQEFHMQNFSNMSVVNRSVGKLASGLNSNCIKELLSPNPTTTSVESCELNGNFGELGRISAWNLPTSVRKEYEKKGINKMFDWQLECLSNPKVLFEHCNLVYSAPTSAGKTLVSEILLIKTILERGKKVIIILPFISVVREKMFYLQDLLTSSGYRVEGFFGGYTPPGGFDNINVAICTIEKANSIVNKLLEQGKLDEIGTVVVDEIHLISDSGRGYILELLLAKILYMSRKYALQIQIITMSATLANVELLKKWLDAELYITNFRPVALQEMIKIGTKIYDNNLKFLREISSNGFDEINDQDHISQLCIETIAEGCSVVVFCPSKDWCENLSVQLAGAIHAVGRSGSEIGNKLRSNIKRDAIEEVKKQLKDIPTGLDSIMEKTINYACAFHHAGLTTEERDVIESCFKSGALKIIVATSTLSSGVNLPARRVIIRSPLFGGKQMSSLTYKQMIGRAGRTGKDTLGESILICTDSNARIGKNLVAAALTPISSCLEMESSNPLKRALLEVISSGVATTKSDIENFVKCTLLNTQKNIAELEKDSGKEANTKQSSVLDSIDFLIEYEFIRLQHDEESGENYYVATRLGMACLASSMPPTDGLILFSELQKSRRCFVLESELHAVYLVTPYSVCYQMQDLDWLMYLDLWEKLSPAMKKVGELVGVKESFLVRAMRGQVKLDYKLMQIHKRFYTALALQELVNETPVNTVATKYKCTRGMLQSLQQMASTFAGIVTAFCNSLNWSMLSLIVCQFKERLFFGVHRDLIDLMRLSSLNCKRARALFDSGIGSLIDLANADVFTVEKILHNSLSFDTAKQLENENEYEKDQRNNMRNLYITGKAGLTVKEAAKMYVNDARRFVQYEIGVININWSQEKSKELKQFESGNENSKRKSNIDSIDESPPKIKKIITEKVTGAYNEKKNAERIPTKRIEDTDSLNPDAGPKISYDISSKPDDRCSIQRLKDMKSTFFGQKTTPSFVENKTGSTKGNSEEEVQALESKNQGNSNGTRPLSCISQPKDIENPIQSAPLPKNKITPDAKIQSDPVLPSETEHKEIIQQNHCKFFNSDDGPAENITQNKVVQPSYHTEQMRKANIRNQPVTKPKILLKKSNITPSTRRSPRNHLPCATRIEKPSHSTKGMSSTSPGNDLFMDDTSFEMNSAIANCIADIKEVKEQPPRKSLNKSSDEIAASQERDIKPKTQSTRFLRSDKEPLGNSTKSVLRRTPFRKKSEKNSSPLPSGQASPINLTPNNSNTIEVSDISLGNSLMQNPIYLNSSHILSTSKTESDALSLNCIHIVDICGSLLLFKNAITELTQAKMLGFSVGIEKQANKRKPLIGANLLINQLDAKENSNEAKLDFPVNDLTYISGISMVMSENISYFLNLQAENTAKGVSREMKIEVVRKLVENAKLTLQIFDSKEQLKILRRSISDIPQIQCKIEDPKVANWLLQPDKTTSLVNMATQFAPECIALVKLLGTDRGNSSIGLDSSNAIFGKVRSSIEACVTMHILRGQVENLKRIGTGQLHKFFIDMEMPLQLSLCDMEIHGFPANEVALREVFKQMTDTMKKLEAKIYETHGSRFYLGSGSAVARVLGLHRKSNGRVCTSKQILEKIDSPIAQMIISYRKLSATLSKTTQPLLRTVVDNRIRGQSITFTSTGRISMQEPNLQNVAKDFDVAIGTCEKINISCRNAFFPPEERCLISADFCQLEMRILAHLSQDPPLLQVMNSEKDIFTAIAAKWNKVAEDSVSEDLRNGTKQICYGIVYGMGMRILSESLKCSEQEATTVSEQFHAAYPGIRLYTEKVIKFARQHGYVETITGRRRYLDNIDSGESQLKNQAERQAVNSTIQGSAADIAKSAILRMEKNIRKYQQKMGLSENCVNLVLHLHDELIFEVPKDKARNVAKILSLTMENCVRLSVPLKVTMKIGQSWGDLREIKL